MNAATSPRMYEKYSHALPGIPNRCALAIV